MSPAPRRRAATNRSADDRLLFRAGARFPRPQWEEGPPEAAAGEKPLTPTERAIYIGFAIWVGMTFLALFAVVVFMHTPGSAN